MAPYNKPVLFVVLIALVIGIGFLLMPAKKPVSAPSPEPRSIVLYLYDAKQDTDERGNVLCSDSDVGLAKINRTIPHTSTPIRDALTELMKGELTEQERLAGLSTGFPLSGLTLESTLLETGKLTLTFRDPEHATSGGSCRTTILRQQIRSTAYQFPEVNDVLILPEDLFQP